MLLESRLFAHRFAIIEYVEHCENKHEIPFSHREIGGVKKLSQI